PAAAGPEGRLEAAPGGGPGGAGGLRPALPGRRADPGPALGRAPAAAGGPGCRAPLPAGALRDRGNPWRPGPDLRGDARARERRTDAEEPRERVHARPARDGLAEAEAPAGHARL